MVWRNQIRYLAAAIRKFREIYPNLRYHITSGDTEQVTEKLDKGIIDFAVLAQEPNTAKYHYLTFPVADLWGVVMPKDCPLAKKKYHQHRGLNWTPFILFRAGMGQ